MSEIIYSEDLWKPVKIYGNYLRYVDRRKYICDQVEGKNVLHVGCADFPISKERIATGALIHGQIVEHAREVMGIDTSEEGISDLKELGYRDLNILDAADIRQLRRKFDTIFADDVLEHMTNPSAFLEAVPDCLTPQGELLLSLPNAYSWSILRYLKGIEPTHFEHCFCFTVKTITHLCDRFNLLPTELAFTRQPPQACESKMFWKLGNYLIRLNPKMAPTLLMKFKPRKFVGGETFVLWR